MGIFFYFYFFIQKKLFYVGKNIQKTLVYIATFYYNFFAWQVIGTALIKKKDWSFRCSTLTQNTWQWTMMMMMMDCFCDMVDRQKPFNFISSRDHCQRSSPSRISLTPRAEFESAVVISTTPRYFNIDFYSNGLLFLFYMYFRELPSIQEKAKAFVKENVCFTPYK